MLRVFCLVFSAILISSCASTSNKDEERAALHLKIGTALLNQGQYPAALSELLKAEKLDPTNPIVQNNLGLSYFVRDRLDLAEKHIRKALSLQPKYTDARNNLGRLLIEKKNYSDAIKELKLASQDLTYNDPSKLMANLGHAYYLNGNFQDARDTFLEALKYRRHDCFSMTLYGQSLYRLKNYNLSTRALDEAIRTCQNNAKEEPYYFSAISYLKLGQRAQAFARLKEYVDTFPKGTFTAKAKNLMQEIQ